MAVNIHLGNISKQFGSHNALDRLSLDIHAGDLVTLLGPSGCGKTTLLRIIAGLEVPDTGQVCFDGVDVAPWDVRRRKVGFVFQNYALFGHMTVEQNVTFGMRMRPRRNRLPAPLMRQKAAELLSLVQLEKMGGRYPRQLSGGQQQRVALARALAIEPRVLLLDEPFGALDAKVRKELRSWLRELQRAVGITCIMVTHDQDEALEISDQVVLLQQGRVEQQGPPQELFEHPINPFALSFLGSSQPLPALPPHLLAPWGLGSRTAGAFLRPHEIKVERPDGNATNLLADIRHISMRGAMAHLQLASLADKQAPFIEAEISRETAERLALKVGDQVSWRPTRLHIFDAQNQASD